MSGRSLTRDRTKYTYYPNTSAVPEKVCAAVLNRPHSITAELEIPKGGAEGVIAAMGSGSGGYVFYIQDKKLPLCLQLRRIQEFVISSDADVPEGRVEVRFEFEPKGKPDVKKGKGASGNTQLYINGELVKEGKLPVTIPLAFGSRRRVRCRPRNRISDHFAIQKSIRVHRHDPRRSDRRFRGLDCR